MAGIDPLNLLSSARLVVAPRQIDEQSPLPSMRALRRCNPFTEFVAMHASVIAVFGDTARRRVLPWYRSPSSVLPRYQLDCWVRGDSPVRHEECASPRPTACSAILICCL